VRLLPLHECVARVLRAKGLANYWAQHPGLLRTAQRYSCPGCAGGQGEEMKWMVKEAPGASR